MNCIVKKVISNYDEVLGIALFIEHQIVTCIRDMNIQPRIPHVLMNNSWLKNSVIGVGSDR